MADTKRRSARVLAERKRSIYFEPASDDDFEKVDSEGEQDYRPERQPSPGPSQLQRPRKKRKVDRRPKPETRAKEKRMQRFKGRSVGRPTKKYGVNWVPPTPSKKKDDITRGFSGPSDGKIPDWTRLPAEIWRDIFIFASQPIHEQTSVAVYDDLLERFIISKLTSSLTVPTSRGSCVQHERAVRSPFQVSKPTTSHRPFFLARRLTVSYIW